MSVVLPDLRLPVRPRVWKWWVCGLLLLATMVNYMDRLTLNLVAPRLLAHDNAEPPPPGEMRLTKVEYGHIEAGFAVAFALGSLVVGWLADRGNVYWVYPAALLAWSAAGFVTGFAQGFYWLFACRLLLGLAEAGHWPCALRTTQHLLAPAERTMGNSLLQSGASIGAIIIPVVVYYTAPEGVVGSWRTPFLVVGGCGMAWVVLWLISLRPADLRGAAPATALEADRPPRSAWLTARRLIALMILVVAINATWHFFRAWIVVILDQLGYNDWQRTLFTSAYYIATDLGALSAGLATLLLARRGFSVHFSRMVVFFAYALFASLAVWAAFLPAGTLLLAILLLVGFGSLGVFPAYYSLSQDLTVKHQGALTGLLSFVCWIALAGWQEIIGHAQSYTLCMVLAGMFPLAAFAALLALWGKDEGATVAS
jgi:ACS family hexuronate transporter-like MFS transporter